MASVQRPAGGFFSPRSADAIEESSPSPPRMRHFYYRGYGNLFTFKNSLDMPILNYSIYKINQQNETDWSYVIGLKQPFENSLALLIW